MKRTPKALRREREFRLLDAKTDRVVRRLETAELDRDASHAVYRKFATPNTGTGNIGGLWAGRSDLGRMGETADRDEKRQNQVVVPDPLEAIEQVKRAFREFTT
jgi:hypothetical protein